MAFCGVGDVLHAGCVETLGVQVAAAAAMISCLTLAQWLAQGGLMGGTFRGPTGIQWWENGGASPSPRRCNRGSR
jgi:hypothetical protein